MPSQDSLVTTFWRNSFGSDELSNYTAEYTWFANQMAHAMMGFFIITCWALYVFHRQESKKAERLSPDGGASAINPSPTRRRNFFVRWVEDTPPFWLMLVPFILLVGKEVIDYVSDVKQFSTSPIELRSRNAILDSITDLSFWYSGMFLALFVASMYFDKQRYRVPFALLGLLICAAVFVPLGKYWTNQKRTFDRSGLPLNYQRLVRLLSEWNDPNKPMDPAKPRDPTKDWVHPFAENPPEKQYEILRRIRSTAAEDEGWNAGHFVVSGGYPEDRSRLVVSLGCEFAFKLRFDEWSPPEENLRKVVYTTAVQVLGHPENLFEQNTKSALRCVIIDDLDVTIDPPVELLLEVASKFPEMEQYYSERTQEKLNRVAEKLPPNLKDKLRRKPFDKKEPKLTTDDVKSIGKMVRDEQPNREGDDDQKRLEVFRKMREILMASDEKISTIWVLSNTGKKRTKSDDPQKNNREKWLYTIAYLTGRTREQLEPNRIEFALPVEVK